MLNKGPNGHGFMICEDCGAAMPGDNNNVLAGIKRPYKVNFNLPKCNHTNTRNVNLGYDFVTDMLVLEFALDEQKIDVDRKNNPWLNRAAQSLAEALRLAASQELDIEFTELVAGYRFRQNSNGAFFDIYLYDSLSSGAGYSASISEEIEFLFTKVEKILSKCDCENACHKCLKHYRNQNVHGQLDRFAALELLRWGKYNELAPEIPHSRQVKYISQFTDIIEASNYHVDISDDMIIINNNNCSKKLIVYPAMKKEPVDPKAIFVSDAYIKYAKPYAVKKIISK